MASSKIDDKNGGTVIVQGFRAGPVAGAEPYVFIGVLSSEGGLEEFQIELTPEDAHFLSEEIRRHAEFALTVREQGE